MKLFKNRTLWQGVAILAITSASVILLFFPDVIENKYPYSYQRITEEKMKVEALNGTLVSNESGIKSSISEVERLEIDEAQVSGEEFKVRKGIIEEDFELHIPSILIALEQNAKANKVDLAIEYGSMTTTPANGSISGDSNPGEPGNPDDPSYPGNPNDPSDPSYTGEPSEPGQPGQPESEIPDVPGMSPEELEKERGKNENVGGDNIPVETANQEKAIETKVETKDTKIETDDGIKISETETEKETTVKDKESKPGEDSKPGEEPGEEQGQSVAVPQIDGIDVTTIPINISGSFFNVRNYIKYLDEVGMIEPSSVIIISKGRTVTASIIINIFHGEVN